MRTIDGKIVNRAAGHNDLGAIIRSQFEPELRSQTNAFEEQQAKEDRQGKRIITSSKQSSAHKKSNAEAGLDFARMVSEKEERSTSRSTRPVEARLSEQRNSSYLYQVLQPELKEKHSRIYKVAVSRNPVRR